MLFEGQARGLQQVSYDNDQYRPTVKLNGETVLVGVDVETMKGAIRQSFYLLMYYRSTRLLSDNAARIPMHVGIHH